MKVGFKEDHPIKIIKPCIFLTYFMYYYKIQKEPDQTFVF